MPGEYKDNAELSSEISASGAGAVLLTVPRMETRIKKLSQFILYKVFQHIACKVNPASGIRTHDAYRKYFKLKILHAKERILKNISLHKELL